MVFHPYSHGEVCEIIPTCVLCEILDNDGALTVLLKKKTEDEDMILRGIHATKDYERRLFGAVKSRFNENLCRWVSQTRPDHCGSNCFIPDDHLTTDDIQSAIDANMERGLNYTMFSMNRPMDAACLDRFAFDMDITYVMAMLEDSSRLWKTNGNIEIRDIQTSDISTDILDVSDVPEEYQAAAYRNMQMVLEIAKSQLPLVVRI